MLNKEKLDQFHNLLASSSLEDADKKNILFLIEYFQKKHNPLLTSRSYIFIGNPGVGKTFLAKSLLESLDLEVVYIASTELSLQHSKRCFSFQEVIDSIQKGKEQIIFLDDLNFLFKKQDCEITSEDQRSFLSILDLTRDDPTKAFISTINYLHELDEQMVDRIEVKVNVDLPSDIHKQRFLEFSFQEHLPVDIMRYIAINSIGYNYRDLVELVKASYRLGDGKLEQKSVQAALKMYKPTQLHEFQVFNGLDTNLNDIIGKKNQLKILQRLVQLYHNETLGQLLTSKRYNLLLFHGPPGTGKTYLARALAGEIGYPLISIKGRNLFTRGGSRIEPVLSLAKRYRNCIFFIDEADKLMGNNRFGEDNRAIGEFNSVLDGIDDKNINAIIILAVNELSRFGTAFRDRFVEVSFDLPSSEERQQFCENRMKKSPFNLNCDYLARITEGMSFRDLEKVWNELVFYYFEYGNKITEDTMGSLLKSWKNEEEETIFG